MYLVNESSKLESVNRVHEIGEKSHSLLDHPRSFFPQTIRDWNDLPDSLFSTAEMSYDCVSKFASLVRSRD